MPLTIPPIPDVAAFATFDEDVDIFSNSKAKDIPAKLKAITEALKAHINTLWLATATGFVNDTVVADLNTAIANIEAFNNALETQINDQLAEFEVSLGNYLGAGAGYSVDAANAALFTGSLVAGDVTYDDMGRVVSIQQGPRLLHNITYNDDGTMAGYAEILTLGGIDYARSFSFSYTPYGQIDAITEV
ncbi:hypothetical protein [Thalassospira alkalitolerans]|uniref:hypothetical protein n=1 Tax=Thalassospira alkalitolerans TaxID=1293890 RepID=UPI0030EE0D5A|tara:strand:+ start:38063 stop:38629 length:567 start_codon:yes stop_codon:yes gene_type:complete